MSCSTHWPGRLQTDRRQGQGGKWALHRPDRPPAHRDEADYLKAGAARDVWESLFLVVVKQTAWFGLLLNGIDYF